MRALDLEYLVKKRPSSSSRRAFLICSLRPAHDFRAAAVEIQPYQALDQQNWVPELAAPARHDPITGSIARLGTRAILGRVPGVLAGGAR
jgi:hypothetical protein